jgi:hypothetical protein
MNPIIEIYQGQSLAPPDQKGLTAGSGIWIRIMDQWYRVESTTSIFKVRAKLIESLDLRKWPWEDTT